MQVSERFGCSPNTVRRVLLRKGLEKHLARSRPVLDEKVRKARLEWAEEHINWTSDQWRRILWSDETWMTYGSRSRVYVTRYDHEAYADDCVQARYQRPLGWMFFGSFHGSQKGPAFIWERKEWGTITADSYQVSLHSLSFVMLV